MGLTCEFCDDAAKQPQWQALLHKGRIDAGTLAETVDLFHSLSWLASQVVAIASLSTATWGAQQLRRA